MLPLLPGVIALPRTNSHTSAPASVDLSETAFCLDEEVASCGSSTGGMLPGSGRHAGSDDDSEGEEEGDDATTSAAASPPCVLLAPHIISSHPARMASAPSPEWSVLELGGGGGGGGRGTAPEDDSALSAALAEMGIPMAYFMRPGFTEGSGGLRSGAGSTVGGGDDGTTACTTSTARSSTHNVPSQADGNTAVRRASIASGGSASGVSLHALVASPLRVPHGDDGWHPPIIGAPGATRASGGATPRSRPIPIPRNKRPAITTTTAPDGMAAMAGGPAQGGALYGRRW